MTLHRPTPSGLSAQPLAVQLTRLIGGAAAQMLHDAAAPQADLPVLRVAPAARALGLQALAAHHSGGPAARKQALLLYTRCLQHYRQQVQPRLSPGQRGDDVGPAAAYFVLANLAALADGEPDDQALPVVERQMRRLLGAASGWDHLPLAERQQCFEQLAAVGVLVNESRLAARAQGPAAHANLAQAARAYLHQLLGLEADRLSVTSAGLRYDDGLH